MTSHEYSEDLALMIGDWYHRSAQEVQDYYIDAKNFGLEVGGKNLERRTVMLTFVQPAPDSIVINGQGAFNCSMEIPARPIECTSVEMQQLRLSGEQTRLRIINTGSDVPLNFFMGTHADILQSTRWLYTINLWAQYDSIPNRRWERS